MRLPSLLVFLTLAFRVQAPPDEIIVVKLKRAPGITADNALHHSWEEARAKVRLPRPDWEEEFTDDLKDDEDPPISQCFVPQIKLITERYTFVVSLGCGNLITFKNKAPFVPSDTRVQNPFDFSDEFRYFIEKVVEKHLKIPPRRLYAEYALSYTPPPPEISYEDLDFLIGQSQIALEDEEEDEEDLPSPADNPRDWMSEDEEEEGDD